eukprot:g44769.t1
MIEPTGQVMRCKVKLFAESLQLKGDPSDWSEEALGSKLDADTGRRLCKEAFAAKREERESKSLLVSVEESDAILARFGVPARKDLKKVRAPFLATVEAVHAEQEFLRTGGRRLKNLSYPGIKNVLQPLAAAVKSNTFSPPPLVKRESPPPAVVQNKKRDFIDVRSDSEEEDRLSRHKKAKLEPQVKEEQ